jgi:SH3-like domain-containing protein
MSLGERLREMLDPGTTQGGSPSPGGPTRRRPRAQAQPVNSNVRSYDASEPSRPMPRAQWIGLGLVAALAVALTAGLVFVILTLTRPGGGQTATPTPLALGVTPTVAAQTVATIFASPAVAASPAAPAVTPQPTIQRLQVANTGGGNVNLRRDPGQDGERITTLQEGTLVEIVGPDRVVDGMNWRNVRTLQGDVGWIASDYLAAEGAAPIAGVPGSNATILPAATAPAPAVANTPAPRPTTGVAAAGASRGQVGNTGGQGANIRSEPGSNGRVLKTLADGSNLEVLGPEREVDGTVWRQVRDPSSGVVGWIVRGAVAPAGSMPTPVPPRTAPTSGPTSAPKPTSGAAPATGPTAAPKPANTPAPGGAPSGAPAATPTTAPAPGNLPVIIQPATPRATSGAAPAATPKPSGGAATPKPSAP